MMGWDRTAVDLKSFSHRGRVVGFCDFARIYSPRVIVPRYLYSAQLVKLLSRLRLVAPRSVLCCPQLLHLGDSLLELFVLALLVAVTLILFGCIGSSAKGLILLALIVAFRIMTAFGRCG